MPACVLPLPTCHAAHACKAHRRHGHASHAGGHAATHAGAAVTAAVAAATPAALLLVALVSLAVAHLQAGSARKEGLVGFTGLVKMPSSHLLDKRGASCGSKLAVAHRVCAEQPAALTFSCTPSTSGLLSSSTARTAPCMQRGAWKTCLKLQQPWRPYSRCSTACCACKCAAGAAAGRAAGRAAGTAAGAYHAVAEVEEAKLGV